MSTITVIVCGVWVYLIGIAAVVLSAPLLLLVLGLPPLLLRYRSRSVDPTAQLTLYVHGLVAVEADGTIRVARYDTTLAYIYALAHPAKAYRGKSNRTMGYHCALTDIAGQRFPLAGYVETEFWHHGGYLDPQKWALAIQDRIVKACFASAAAELVAGQTLAFGPIHLSAIGISTDGPPVAWPRIEEVRAQSGRLGITVDEAWHPLNGAALEHIPNYRLLIALTDHLRHPVESEEREADANAEPDEQNADDTGEPETD
ncbi:DUF6585 family protein [Nocardia colli]|uniref:DUF6585 family protein n=1 Tax=Nocardia colli TaxID=2545717 RepID=UPI0035D7910A